MKTTSWFKRVFLAAPNLMLCLIGTLALQACAGSGHTHNDHGHRHAHGDMACGAASAYGEKTEAALRAFYGGDVETLDSLIAERYIQHSNAQDGKQALLDVVAKGRSEGWLNADAARAFTPLRTVADGDLAATHYLDKGENKVYIDIFRFDDTGKITEHWDVSQAFLPANRSGRTMIDGQSEAKCITTKAEQAEHKAIVQRLYDDFFGKGDNTFLANIMTEAYLQHNPHGQDGRAFFAGFIDRMGEVLENEIHLLIADGDLVYAVVEYPARGWASVDIFRFEDGKIAEHWDVLQDIPKNLPHDNGYF